MPAPKIHLKREAIRLRKEENLSYKEIQEKLGVSKGSLSHWLRAFPLTESQQKASRRRTRADKGVRRKSRGIRSKHHKTLRGRRLHRDQMARLSEAAVAFRLCLHGYRFFRPQESDVADFLVEAEPEVYYQIQVKTATEPKGHGLPAIPLRNSAGGRGRRRYRRGEFDFIVGYDLYTDTCYVYSWDDTKHLKASVAICPEAEEAWEKLRQQ